MKLKNSESGMLSVIIPVYNCREYLERCVQSVLAADPFEVIIVDDGSNDGTDRVYEKMSEDCHDIVVVRNKVNQGVVVSRCAGVSKARGEYIAFVDADDWIEAEFLIQAVQELKVRKSIDIVVGRALQDNGKGKTEYVNSILEEKVLEHREAIQGLFDWNLYRWELWGKVYRKKLFYGWMPDESVKICEDLDSTWELFRNAVKTLCLPMDYYHYFYNEQSASHTVNSAISNSYKVFEKIYKTGKNELDDFQVERVQEHYRCSLINLIRELLLQGGDRIIIEKMQFKLDMLYKDSKLNKTAAMERLCRDYSSARNLIEEMERETVNLFYDIKPEGERVYLYGTGIVSDFVSKILQRNGCLDFGYVVSTGQMKKTCFHGRNVLYLDQIEKKSVILLSVSLSLQNQLYCKLKNSGYHSIYKFDTQGVV